MENKYVLDICTLIFKILNGSFPSWLYNITRVNEMNNRITRQENDLYIPQTRTVVGERQDLVRGPKLWNKLPVEIKNTASIAVFKKSLKKYLLQNQ